MTNELITTDEIVKNKIQTIRGKQVLLDRDIAELYGVETKILNKAVKRNIERFPDDFMFKLNKAELNNLMFQNGTSSWGGIRKLPFAFTEHGITTLSGILKSEKAIEINIKIIRAFISMRNFLLKNKDVFNRLNLVERKQIEYEIKTDKNFESVFNALQLQEPKQGIFFEGQIFDAYVFVSKLIRQAKQEIILIDNYVDEKILEIFTKTKVNVNIYTKNMLNLDVEKVQRQYKNIKVVKFDKSHDRFLIIDSEIYLIGASLKDLGKRWFAFSKIESESIYLLEKLKR